MQVVNTKKKLPENTLLTKINYFFREYWKNRYLLLLLLPGIIFFIVFKYIPMYGLQIAFKDYKFLLGIHESPWIGLDTFRKMFAMESFWQVFRNTLVISFYQLVIGFPAPIIFALLLNEVRKMKFKKVVQTISYLPHFVSWVVLGGLFMQFLSPSIGPINILIKALGGQPIYFLADTDWFRTVLVSTEVWKGLGWNSIIYLAALSGIDPALYEAAKIDGAGRFKQVIHVTIPSLIPIITIMIIFATGKVVNDNFDQVFNLYNPAVYSVGDVLSTYTYRRGVVNMEYSFATAVGLFKNVISFGLVVGTNYIARRINDYGLW
ncbi:ABC transporter permease [Vallitalea okinawensis]|uniref:ABC transporter permease n=1 Tax=Vallitalea okinawensis TaxID=2078660 RepID=UPI000CFCB422|nr:ABC transporter permease subunit [Vallitalea okinawensis]